MQQGLPFAAPTITPIDAIFKASAEDFEVEELPAYLPNGAGEHLYVHFEKRGLDTEQAVRAIAGVLGSPIRDAGWAGLKDKHAVTRQWASFLHREPRPDLRPAEAAQRSTESALASLAEVQPGIRVLEVSRHNNKLRTGHLHGNRFVLRLRGVDAARFSDLESTMRWLCTHGAPQFYGVQRFGRGGDNVERAKAWIVDGGRAPFKPFEKKLLVSALQSAVFNSLLAARVERNELSKILDGDLVRKEDSGGLFIADDVAEVQARADRLEVSATGPMLGAEMKWPEREAKAREEEAMRAFGLDQTKLERVKQAGAGTRRAYRVLIQEGAVALEGDAVRVSFTLPAGAYATEILRELTRGGAHEPERPRWSGAQTQEPASEPTPEE